MRHVKQKDPKQRVPFGDAVCPAAALLPFFGFFGFLLMAKRSGRDRYARFARIYAGANAVLLLLYLLLRIVDLSLYQYAAPYGLPSDFASFLFLFRGTQRLTSIFLIDNTALQSVFGYADTLLPVLRTILYIGCLVHTAVCIPGYIRYLKETVYPYRCAGAAQRLPRKKRLLFSLWMLWCLVPAFGWFAPLYAARISGNRRMRRLCTALLSIGAACLLLTLPENMQLLYIGTSSVRLMKTIGNKTVQAVLFVLVSTARCYLYVTPIASYLLSAMLRPEAVEASAAAWFRDTAAHPVLASAKWRLRNSLWQFLTLLPFAGGLGPVVGGTGARNRRMIRIGLLHLSLVILFAVPMILLYYAGVRINDYDPSDPLAILLGSRYIDGLRNVLQHYGFYLLWWLGVALGCMFRREALCKRAEALGDCRSGIDREIRLTKRFLSLGAVPATAAAGGFAAPDPIEPYPQRTAFSDAAPDAPTDPNTCSEPELRAIPGMTPEAAARVLTYRTTHGEIRSEEELVDVLALKPHRSARILENVAFSAPAPSGTESRRRIDL